MDYWILWYLCFRSQRNACFSVVHALRQLRSWARSLCPCCATTGIWSDSAESRAGAAVAVYRRSLLPFVPQRQIPMVLPVQKTIQTLQLQSFSWSMPLLCRSCACPLLCTTEVQTMPTAPAIFHVPRLSGVYLGVTEVLCAVTDQGPRILLDFLCTSGGVSQMVPTSSGYTWISRELHAVHVMLEPSLGVGFFFGRGEGPVHRHRAGRAMPTGTWPPRIRCILMVRYRQRYVINTVLSQVFPFFLRSPQTDVSC